MGPCLDFPQRWDVIGIHKSNKPFPLQDAFGHRIYDSSSKQTRTVGPRVWLYPIKCELARQDMLRNDSRNVHPVPSPGTLTDGPTQFYGPQLPRESGLSSPALQMRH